MKKKVTISIILFLVIVIIVTMLNPIRRSTGHIRESLLTLMPIGTSMEDVIKVIEGKSKWKRMFVSDDGGYYVGYGYPSGAVKGTTVGVKSIYVLLGTYNTYMFIDTYVEAFWGFDEEGKLIEIDVRKSYDVL